MQRDLIDYCISGLLTIDPCAELPNRTSSLMLQLLTGLLLIGIVTRDSRLEKLDGSDTMNRALNHHPLPL